MREAMTANINVRTTPKLKAKRQKLFEDWGLDTSTAINMFLKDCVREKSLPFRFTREEARYVPNAETVEALKEAKEISKDKNAVGYTNMKDFVSALHDEVKKA